MLTEFCDKHVLLLQGPLGPFFYYLYKDLKENSAKVTKINFCGGDDFFFFNKDTVKYKDSLENWPEYLKKFILEKKIDTIIVLGDCRPYHAVAKKITQELEIDFYSFEEGYLRPDFITLEKDGVNGYSKTPQDPAFFLSEKLKPLSDIEPVGKVFGASAWYAMAYYTAMTILKPLYPNYVHHRPSSGLKNGLCFVRGFYRKIFFSFTEKNFLSIFLSRWKNKYFLFPLQVHNDYQFIHSDFESMEQCIDKVISSFSSSAPKNLALVIKHHPADRPYKDYTKLVNELSEKYNLKDRLFYVHDVHLPALLKHACGTVVMNSTVGLSSVFHQTPVMVLAKAVYKIPGMVYDKTLEDFWISPTKVDMKLYSKFRGWLEHNNQYNGSFYKRIIKFKNHTGVNWQNKK